MKKLVFVSALCGLVLAFGDAVDAAVLDQVRFNVENCTVEVNGNLGESYGDRLVTVYLKDGELSELDQEALYAKVIRVSEDGSWSDTFGFSGNSGTYTVAAVYDNESGHQTEEIYNKETLDQFVSDVANQRITGSELLAAIKKYASSLGVEVGFASSDKNNNILLARIAEGLDDIKANGSAGLSLALENAKKECDILQKIENATSWYDIDMLITEHMRFMGVSASQYAKLENSKIDLCSEIKGKNYSRLRNVADEINHYKTASDSGNTGGGYRGGAIGGKGNGTGVVPAQKQEQTELVPLSEPVAFSDIADVSWAVEAIHALYKKEIISGVGDKKFAPNLNVKREEAAKMIANAFGFKNAKQELSFKDCDKNDWYYDFVSALTENGIITGQSEDRFGVGENITRQDLAVILYRTAEKQGYQFENEKDDFTDFERIGDYAKEAVKSLAGAKIISGMEDGSFAPMESATRAQTAKMVYELMKIINAEV